LRSQPLLRIFSTFPDGLPGAGLLLLRAAAGAVFMVQGAAYLMDWHDLRFLILSVALLTAGSGALLVVGYLTPLAGVLAGFTSVGCAFSWFPSPNPDLFDARLTAVLAAAIAAALVCLGPGAFSLDARLFGRREIIIPNTSRTPEP
jgi:uncharacterized membrane protein YphA (DoxX/SURF4 family)